MAIRPRLQKYCRITLQNQPAHVAAASVTTKNLRDQEGPTLDLLPPRNKDSELLPGVWKLAWWLLAALCLVLAPVPLIQKCGPPILSILGELMEVHLSEPQFFHL